MFRESSKKAAKNPRPKPALLLAGLGGALLVAGISLLGVRLSATHGNPALPRQQSDATGNGQPSEKKPGGKAIAGYTVPADQPRRIHIDTPAIDGLIQRVGVTAANAMATPSDVFYAGWYTRSALPGQPGLSIVNGHVAGKYTDGIFKHLTEVRAGAAITVEFGDKTTRQFTVVDTRKLSVAEAAAYLLTKRPGIAAQLNLITCDGVYDPATHSYSDRFIAVAKLAGS